MDIVEKYFASLTEEQKSRFDQLMPLYREWNEKINVISRKDVDSLEVHHVLHSLSLAKVMAFKAGTRVLDVGTGGGFPGIPLAILFPEVEFHLVDSIGKKVKVVENVASVLGLRNVRVSQARVESMEEQFDFIVSRAVTAFPAFVSLIRGRIRPGGINALPNGFFYLKGGDFAEEIAPYGRAVMVYDIRNFFTETFFDTKKIIYMQVLK